MRNFIIVCMAVSLCILSTGSVAQETDQKTGVLTVVVTGVKNDDGVVMVALYNSEETYSSKGEPEFEGRIGEIENTQSTVIFDDLSFGEYAIKLFHDENENGELDTNFLGIPKEDYAFSNNAKGSFGPPKYDKVKFELAEDLTLEISLEGSDDKQ